MHAMFDVKFLVLPISVHAVTSEFQSDALLAQATVPPAHATPSAYALCLGAVTPRVAPRKVSGRVRQAACRWRAGRGR